MSLVRLDGHPWRTEGSRLLRVAMGEDHVCRKIFASRIGVALSHLSMLEHGWRRPSLDVAAKIETATLGGVRMIAWTHPPMVTSQVVNSVPSTEPDEGGKVVA